MQQFAHGDRVEDRRKIYGTGTVIFLDGDLMLDGSGRCYDWPGSVCVEFDQKINGEKPAMWCEYGLIRKIGE